MSARGALATGGARWATMADVARRAGVSTMTVSNVYKRPERVAVATRESVLRAATELGFVPNAVAGNLASGRSRLIAAIVPSLSNSYFHATLQGLMDELRAHGYQAMLADAGYDPRDEERVVEAFLARRPDGIMLTGTRHTARTVALLRERGVPLVEAWETRGPFVDMGIGYSHHRASAALTSLLIAKGHRAIGYIDHRGDRARRHRERARGVRDTLEAAGLRHDLVAELPAVGGFVGASGAMRELLERCPALSAVVAGTDVYAVGAMFECQRHGRRIPRDVAICGFGDLEIGRAACPALTTVDTRSHEIGRGSARMLLAAIDGERPAERVHDVGFEILERGST